MTYDPEQILVEEFQLMLTQEPSFGIVEGDLRHWTGKINQITLDIKLDEMHPFVRPVIKIRGSFKHRNVNRDGSLSLQILDEWEPSNRISGVIAAIRRLFSHLPSSSSHRPVSTVSSSRPSVQTVSSVSSSARSTRGSSSSLEQLQFDIVGFQEEIETINEQLSTKRASLVKETSSYHKFEIKSSPDQESKAELFAVNDLLELIEVKFEEADIDQVEYVRLFKKYIKRQYILQNTVQR